MYYHIIMYCSVYSLHAAGMWKMWNPYEDEIAQQYYYIPTRFSEKPGGLSSERKKTQERISRL